MLISLIFNFFHLQSEENNSFLKCISKIKLDESIVVNSLLHCRERFILPVGIWLILHGSVSASAALPEL